MENSNELVSVICPNCGASIIGLANNLSIKCHWCHTVIPQDAYKTDAKMPDRILPFKITKEEAVKKIDEYMKTRKEYAKKEFLDDFKPEEIIPVYLPYMLVDAKVHAVSYGIGEKSEQPDENERSKYRFYISRSKVKREFDISIDDLLIESSKSNSFDRVNSTSNVISAVSPFDTENSVVFNSLFLNGYSSENRELEVSVLNSQLNEITNTIARSEAKKMSDDYDRGVRLNNTSSQIIGSNWSSALLPVYLYSYYEKGTDKTYYIAVNGRTGKTIGSIPFNEKEAKIKLLLKMILICLPFIIMAIVIYILLFGKTNDAIRPQSSMPDFPIEVGIIIFVIYWILYFIFYSRYDRIRSNYTNKDVKIDYVNDSKHNASNISKEDEVVLKYWSNLRARNNSETKVSYTFIE